MTQYELMNLDLGCPPAYRSFIVGPYTIELIPSYDAAHACLFHNALSVEHSVIHHNHVAGEQSKAPAQFGECQVTATVTCEDEPDSVLSSGDARAVPEKVIYDVCTILSYLTGRRVHLPEDRYRYSHRKYIDGAVDRLQLPAAARIAWDNRAYFGKEKEIRPLWYYQCIGDTPEAEVKLLLGCVALEIAQSVDEPKEAPPRVAELDRLIINIRETIDTSDVDQLLKNSLKSAAGNWGPSNAQEKFRNLLIDYGIAPPDVAGKPLDRIQSIFKLRNGIAHGGEITHPTWVPDAAKEQTAIFIVSTFIPHLVQYYINRRFRLLEFDCPNLNERLLKEYIENGTWEDEQVEI